MSGRHDEEGAVAVFVALLIVVLMTMVALTVDVGGMMLRRREMVNGSDASALAAALTYIRREWGHTASPVASSTVKETRAASASRTRPWTAEELAKLR